MKLSTFSCERCPYTIQKDEDYNNHTYAWCPECKSHNYFRRSSEPKEVTRVDDTPELRKLIEKRNNMKELIGKEKDMTALSMQISQLQDINLQIKKWELGLKKPIKEQTGWFN